MKDTITIKKTVQAPIAKVWQFWTEPEHITQWNAASDDWHTPKAENNLKEGGRFVYRMEAKDGSVGFDFGGNYTAVKPKEHLAYALDDDRKVSIDFKTEDHAVTITEIFEPENENPVEMQKQGWQTILDKFKTYTESKIKIDQNRD